MPSPDGPDVSALIAAGRESPNLEYKQSAPWDDLRVNLIRTVLGMTNTRDGGAIVVGVAERDGAFNPDGMDAGHIASFPTEENLRAAVNGFAEPFVEPLLDEREHDGKRFLVITVPELGQEPVLCRKTEGRLREGALYVRSTRTPETVEARTPTDTRALLRLATEKALEREIARLRAIGLLPPEAGAAPSAEESFAKQAEEI